MEIFCASSSRGQVKIQEMAFVLVGIMVFFGIVILIFSSIYISGLKKQSVSLGEDEAKQIVRKIASSPELIWGDDSTCASGACVDVDKALILIERTSYQGFWNLDYLRIDRVYPQGRNIPCSKGNYPDCNSIVIINKTSDFGSASDAFVSLCKYEAGGQSGYVKCEIGRIWASGKGINE